MSGRKGSRGVDKKTAKDRFLEAFRQFGFLYQAAEAVGVDRGTVLLWRKADPEFDQAIRDSEIRMTEMLERSALQRALIGSQRNVYHNGRVVGNYREKSDTLTIFLLKARNREKYGDRLVHEVQIRFASSLVTEIVKALRTVPQMCPHCKTSLSIRQDLGATLLGLSRSFEEEARRA